MSAIGDYIHLTGKGYLEHGTTRNGSFNAWKSQKGIIAAKAKANKSSLTPDERFDLEQTISAMMNVSPGSTKIANAQYGVETILNQKFGESTRRINWNTGGMEWDDGEKGRVLGKIHRQRNAEGQLELDLQKTKDKAEKLWNIMSTSLSKTPLDAKKLDKDKKALQECLQQIQRKIKANTTNRGWTWKKAEMTDYQLMQKINELIEEYAAYPAMNAQQGLAFEAMIAMAPYVAQDMAYEEAAKQISGAIHEKVQFDTKKFASFVQAEIGDNVFMSTSGSSASGKVDVQLHWNNKLAKISAKNVNLSSGHAWVHIVSGSSLLYLLQDVNANFVNHFLNLVAEHSDRAGLTGMRNTILEEVKLILFYKALTGSNYGRSTADTFVINDNSRPGGVRVYCMNDIVQSVLKSGSTRNISVNNGSSPLANIRLQNDFIANDTTGASRISKLLANAHQQKISVKFNASNVLKFL